MLEIARMRRALDRTPGFAARIFTDDERAYCDRCAHPAEHYAARFAAREAVLKALGTGFSQGIGLKDVSVIHDGEGRPSVLLAGRAREVAQEQGVQEIALSLSFTHDVAVANAVCVSDEVRPKKEEREDPKAELQRSFKEARGVLAELEQIEEGAVAPSDVLNAGSLPEATGATMPADDGVKE